ncbi:hypothetical protein ACRRTK_014447 [Alexandromys fortis]
MHYSSLRRAKSCPGPAGSEKMQGSEPRHRKPAPGGGLWAHGRRPGLPREERLAFWSRAVPLPVRCSAGMYACPPEEGTRSHYRWLYTTM